MKWFFGLKERFKLAVYLTAIFIISILANLLERTQVNEVDKSIISMYNDRIIPAKDISIIQGKFYESQLLLQAHIHASDAKSYSQIEKDLDRNNSSIDSLVGKFEKTFLVDKEVVALNDYKSKIDTYRKAQHTIISKSKVSLKTEAFAHYQTKGQIAFQKIMEPIHQLSDIQAQVGQELYKASHEKLAGNKMLYSLEIAIAIAIALIVHFLLKASSIIIRAPQKPSLN